MLEMPIAITLVNDDSDTAAGTLNIKPRIQVERKYA
jgi:hypothetical protein